MITLALRAGALPALLTLLVLGGCSEGGGVRTRGGEVDRRHQATLFAGIDTTLALAVEQAQLAALEATDVSLRSFAVQQVAQYSAIRASLREAAVRLDAVPTVSQVGEVDAIRAENLVAELRGVKRPHFDHVYVSYALALHRELLSGLDAALEAVDDPAAREALGGLRDSLGATLPPGDAGRGDSAPGAAPRP